jgi:hypothetical protein
VSISSKTSVAVSSASARTCRIASATRLSSPPDGDAGERPGRLAGVRGEAEHDLVDPARVEGERVPVDLHGRLVVLRRPATEPDLEHTGREPELDEDRVDCAAESRRRRTTRRREIRRGRGDLAEQPCVVRLAHGALVVEARSRSASAAARSPWAMTAASSSP